MIDKAFIEQVLRDRHSDTNQWLFATEVQTETGMADRRLDAFAINCYSSHNYERICYEIKCNRSDWLSEIKTPIKRMKGFLLSNKFFFVLAKEIFRTEDFWILDQSRKRFRRRALYDVGILEIDEEGKIEILQKAKSREAWPLPMSFFCSFARRCRDQNNVMKVR